MFRNAKELVKKSWKILLGCYIIGYALPLIMDGVPNIYYLIPIKATAVPIAWMAAAPLHRVFAKRDRKKEVYRASLAAATENTFIGCVLWVIAAALIAIICWGLNIDPTPFYGNPRSRH